MKPEYVVGFLTSCGYILLIQKNHPEWQNGKLNGPGGKVEEGEKPEAAIIREFGEETGLMSGGKIHWTQFLLLDLPSASIRFYKAETDTRPILLKQFTAGEEGVDWYVINDLFQNKLPVINNLNWIVRMMLDTDHLEVVAVSTDPHPR